MDELQRQAESFEEAAEGRRLSPDDFLRLDQAITNAENELTPLTTSKPDTPEGAGGAFKLRALVERHEFQLEKLFSHPQAKKDLQALLPGLDEVGLREFVREFVQELRQRQVRCEKSTLAAEIRVCLFEIRISTFTNEP